MIASSLSDAVPGAALCPARCSQCGVVAQEDVDAAGVEVRVAPQRLVQRAHAGADVGGGAERRLARGQGQGLAGHALHEGAGEAGRGVEGQAAVVEGPAEGALQARDELHALEAAEADLALERGLRGDGALGPGAAGLAGERADDVQHEVEHRLGPGPGCGHSLAGCHCRHSTGAGRHAQTAGRAEA